MSSAKLSFLQANNSSKKQPSPRIGIMFIVLIILLAYSVPLVGFVSGSDYNKYIDLTYLYVVSSYIIIVLSIVVFHSSNLDIFQDHFSLWTIAFSCFLRASLGGEGELFYKGILAFLGVVLSSYIIVNRRRIKVPSLKSLLIGILWSLGTVSIIAILTAILVAKHGILPSNLLSYMINASVFQLSFVTVIEESCFRGLLFSFMVMNGLKENSALMLQAILFWGAHYMKMNNPVLFFVASPILILSITLVIKKYRMLYLAIIMHTLQNVFGPVLVALL